MKLLSILCLSAVLCASQVSAQQPREKPMELEALRQYAGDWTTDVTSKPAEWAPHEVKYRCSNHAEFVPNGWFLQHIEVNHIVGEPDKITKSLFVWTFDPSSQKYVGWSFQSTGNVSKATGTWDSTSKTFSHSDSNPPPSTTGKLTETFATNNSINGSLAFTRNDGVKLFDMVWTRTRQAGVAGKPLTEEWAKIGTPIQPIPDEVKKLEAFVGAKDVEFIHRPSITSPQGSTTRTVTTGEWILDGRFVLARTGVGEKQSFFVSGYDSNKRVFRYVRFGFNGEVEENIGLWNEAARSFEWNGVGDATGLTRTSTSRVLSNGAIETHILTKTADGKVQMDLTIKSTPRK